MIDNYGERGTTRVFTSNCISRLFWFGHATGGLKKFAQLIFLRSKTAALQLRSPAGCGGEDNNAKRPL